MSNATGSTALTPIFYCCMTLILINKLVNRGSRSAVAKSFISAARSYLKVVAFPATNLIAFRGIRGYGLAAANRATYNKSCCTKTLIDSVLGYDRTLTYTPTLHGFFFVSACERCRTGLQRVSGQHTLTVLFELDHGRVVHIVVARPRKSICCSCTIRVRMGIECFAITRITALVINKSY